MKKLDTVIKRDGRTEAFDLEKIETVIFKAFAETKEVITSKNIKAYASDIKSLLTVKDCIPQVEEIQDMVELKIADKYPKTAIAYAKFRTKQEMKRAEGWALSELGKRIYEAKYRYKGETFDAFLDRISGGNSAIRKRLARKQFLFGGRILAGRGANEDGRKVTLSNCYVLPSPKDTLESIFTTAKEMARTFSYGGGVGISLSNLRPKGMKVNNSAIHTTGAVSFMELYSVVTKIIGQKGRRGALMIAMDIKHPDVYDFLKEKWDLSKVTSANVSLQISDKFMEAVRADDMWLLEYENSETHERLEKLVHASNLFSLICKYAWDVAEPGVLFWDTINKWHLMSAYEGYKFSCTNPCGELPLVDYGACLLGSINLSAFVLNPFTKEATFDINEFILCVHDAIRALNEVLDDNIPLHPLEGQRQYAKDYRSIGLGIMGLADMLLMLGHQYGSASSISISKTIGFTMINESIVASALLAKEFGTFPKYNKEATLASEFFKSNIDPQVQKLVEQYGLYNSQLLAIAPTGSLSTMWGISGGIEPHYNIKYTRKVESIGDGDEYYDVFTPGVEEFLFANPDLKDTDIKIATNLDYTNRIELQSAWQQFIDSAISSTINLPEETTVEQIKDIYTMSWKYGLKGVTVYRDKCRRSGILGVGTRIEDAKTEYACPECGTDIIKTGGCTLCLECGWSACSV